jgi:uncharacterized protein YqfA (UPF0365 family)
MDYYKLKNIQADTSMRDAIGGSGESSQDQQPQAPPPVK